VSTDDQAESGASLTAQSEAIKAECARNGWELVEIIEDAGVSAKNMIRPGLAGALSTLQAGGANVLMAAKLDRLSRSTRDVCEIGDMAQHYGFDLCLLDVRIDTTTPHGRAQLSMMATFAQLERELIGLRTREALAVKRSQGVQLGRRATLPEDIAAMIARLRESGATYRAIAAHMNEIGTPTAQGGATWHPTTIKSICDRMARAA
jgi:DNA invertase Pin-like site-specific DNA recombinase